MSQNQRSLIQQPCPLQEPATVQYVPNASPRAALNEWNGKPVEQASEPVLQSIYPVATSRMCLVDLACQALWDGQTPAPVGLNKTLNTGIDHQSQLVWQLFGGNDATGTLDNFRQRELLSNGTSVAGQACPHKTSP